MDQTTRFELKKEPRQARARATVDAIVAAAAQVLVREGYARSTTNRIANRAGVSIGSLYEYFPGKEAVFAELRRREAAKWYARLVAEPRPVAPRDVIRHLVVGRVDYVRADLKTYVALETEIPRRATADLELEVFEHFKALSTAYFRAHRDELRRFSDLDGLAEFLMRVVSSTIHDYALHAPDRLKDNKVIDAIIDMLERYLLR